MKKVHRLQTELADLFSAHTPNNNNGIDGVSIGSQNGTIQGRLKSKLNVYHNDQLSVEIPNGINGVPISRKETKSHNLDCIDECNKYIFDPLPGGVPIDEYDETGPGSTTCMVERNNTYYIMTARHIFGCDPSGKKAYNYDVTMNYVGTEADYNVAEDWIIFPLDAYSDTSNFDNSIEGQPGILAGHVTKRGLQNLKDTEENVYHQGWRSCETVGKVEELDKSVEACYTSNKYVELTTCTESGDSGGPHFHQYTVGDCIYNAIIAPHRGSNSIGCAAYHINNYHGIKFDPRFSEESDCIQ